MKKAGDDYVNHVVEKLSAAGNVRSRAMFGGYGIFHDDVMFALVSESVLYFKVDESNRQMYERAGSYKFPHGISYWAVPDEIFEDAASLAEWADVSIQIARAKAKKKRK